MAAVFCGAMASGGWSFKTILRTLGGPARGVVRPGRYAPGAGYTIKGKGADGSLSAFLETAKQTRVARLDVNVGAIGLQEVQERGDGLWGATLI